MKTLEVPEKLFEQLEEYRRSKRISRNEALERLLQRARLEEKWWRDINRRTPAAKKLTGEEADCIATKEVRAERHSRR